MKNSLKKLLCTMLSIMMLLSMLSISAAAKPSYTLNTTKVSTNEDIGYDPDLLFYEDFAPEVWSDVTTDMNSLERNKIKVGESGPKTFTVKGNRNFASAATENGLTVGDTGYFRFKHTYKRGVHFLNNDAENVNYFSGKYVTEFKFKQDSYTKMDALFRAAAVNAEGTPYKHPLLQLDKDGNLYYYDTTTHKIASFNTGEWNKVKLILDVDNEKFDIYFNDVLVADDALFGGNNEINGKMPVDWEEGATKRIDRFFDIEFGVAASSVDEERGITYYDDIKIYKATEGEKTWGLVPVAENLFYEDFAPENWKDATIINEGDYDWNGKIIVGKSGPKQASLRRNRKNGGLGVLGASVGETGYLRYYKSYFRGINLYNTDAANPEYFSGKYVTEFKFKQDSFAKMDTLFAALAMNGEDHYAFPHLRLNDTGMLYYHDTVARSVAQTTEGEWHTVKLIIDVDNEKYDIYLNGVLCKKDAAFGGDASCIGGNRRTWQEGETKRIDRFFQIEYGGTNAEDVNAVTYYDDIKIYREPVDRNTLWANDLTAYESDVTYNTNPLANFAGLGNNFATGGASTTPNATLSAENDAIEIGNSGGVSVRGFKNTLTDNATMEFDFSVSGPTRLAETIAAMKDPDTYGASISLLGNELFVYGKDKKKHILIPDVVPGKTYRITLHTDLTKEQDGIDGADSGASLGTTGTYDVYVDGICRASGIETLDGSYKSATLPHIDRIFNVVMNTLDDVTLSYRNFILYQDVREEVMAEAALWVGAYTDESSISLPTSFEGFDGYTVEWKSSDESVIDVTTGAVARGLEEKTVTLTAIVSDADKEYVLARKFEVVVPDTYETSVSYENDAVTASASETVAAGKTLLLAVYDGAGAIVDIKSTTVAEGNNSVSVSSSELTDGSYTAKVFLWNSTTEINPVCKSKAITFVKAEN